VSRCVRPTDNGLSRCKKYEGSSVPATQGPLRTSTKACCGSSPPGHERQLPAGRSERLVCGGEPRYRSGMSRPIAVRRRAWGAVSRDSAGRPARDIRRRLRSAVVALPRLLKQLRLAAPGVRIDATPIDDGTARPRGRKCWRSGSCQACTSRRSTSRTSSAGEPDALDRPVEPEPA
jgi:hypothetical protein